MKNALLFENKFCGRRAEAILLYFIKIQQYKDQLLEKKRQGRQNCRFKKCLGRYTMYVYLNQP